MLQALVEGGNIQIFFEEMTTEIACTMIRVLIEITVKFQWKEMLD